MKKILITGKNSYIGNSFVNYVQEEKRFEPTCISLRDNVDLKVLEGYDVVLHVAGIVHRPDATTEMYEKVNHELAVDVATYAKNVGVKQFILMSSGAVYTQNDRKHKMISVNENSPMSPSTGYGISKMNAENDIKSIVKGSEMKLSILRPAMVYGKNAKGNYPRLSKLVQKCPVFPDVENNRSILYIDNLCELIKLIILEETEGSFLPQNKEYISTKRLIQEIAKVHNKKVLFTKCMNPLFNVASAYIDSLNKLFGTYCYERPNGDYFEGRYQVVGFEESIRLSERI